jgi:hypothetical protein
MRKILFLCSILLIVVGAACSNATLAQTDEIGVIYSAPT